MGEHFELNGKVECIKCAKKMAVWIEQNMPTSFSRELLESKLSSINTLGCDDCKNNPCSMCLLSKENLSGT